MMATIAGQAEQFLKKPTKKDALGIIKRVYETADDERTKMELAKLYKYFVPSLPKKPKNNFQWAALACEKKKNTPDYEIFRHVRVTKEKIVATDTFRLHQAPNDNDLAPGFYNHVGDKVLDLDELNYPEVDEIMAKFTDNARHVEPVEQNEFLEQWETIERDGAFYLSRSGGKIAYNRQFFLEAASTEDIKVYVCRDNDNYCPLLLTNDSRVAIIMPFIMTEE
jgi:hypothetical protein